VNDNILDPLPYLNDPLTVEFEADITQKTTPSDNVIEVILNRTYFYPTGGGQDADTGTLNDAVVLGVFKTDTGAVVHRLDRDVVGPRVRGRINAAARRGNMQHHSAQHILSAALEEALSLPTQSSAINATTPTTIDVPWTDIDMRDLLRAENLANAIVTENRPINTYFITDAEVAGLPFRRPPKVSGQIRVVEVAGFDVSACGGTHCPTTGMIGAIKIIKTEKKNQKRRIYVVAGQQALSVFQHYHSIVTELGRYFSTGPDELVEVAARQLEQGGQAQRALAQLQAQLAGFEVDRLNREAQSIDGYRRVAVLFRDRPLNDLRQLAKSLQPVPDLVAVLAGFDGRKLALVVSCGIDSGISARDLLASQLATIGGRGGGDHRLAQGGGEVTEEQVEQLFP
jgi:alanyl-tRNA synthetase